MGIDCSHGSFSVARIADFESGSGCSDCRIARIEELLIRIADAMDRIAETEAYDSALNKWEMGQGRHPDD